MPGKWATPDRLFLFGLILAAAVYGSTLRSDFVFDDVHLILLNDSLDSWSRWTVAFTDHVWAFHQPPAGARHYRPVFVLWLLVNKQLFGDIAPWWHLTSLLLHLVATTLVYRLALRLMPAGRDEDGAWSAAFAALLFALHPVHIEPVAWISASTDLLTAVFLIASFLCYLNYSEPPDSRPSWFVASLALAAAAILSKETAAVFPAVILSYELFNHRSAARFAPLARALPFAAVVVFYLVARRFALPHPAPSSTDANALTILTSLPLVAAAYAKTLFWPFQLSFFYDPAAASQWTTASALAVLLAMAAMIFLLRSARANPAIRLPLAWLVIFTAPALIAIAVFTRDNWVHDRHMYVPSIGFCLLAALLLARLARLGRTLVTIVLTAILTIALALQLPRFADELNLYEHALGRSPHNIELRLAYADALQLHGRPQDSQREYERIVQLAPASAEAWIYLGMDYDDAGHTQRARAALERGLAQAAPGSHLRMRALFRLGSVELKLGELAAAEAHLRGALELDPQGWNYHATLAEVLRQQGRTAEAEWEMQLEAAARQASVARRARPQ